MFENEYTLKKLYEVINDDLEKKAFENRVLKDKHDFFRDNQLFRLIKFLK
jgi:hypothetical protein